MNEAVKQTNYHSAGIDILPQQGTVGNGDSLLRLGPVNMKVLVALLAREGTVVTREALFQCVWPNQVVSDETLTKSVSDIRVSLSKLSEDVKFIHTVPKKGYQWLPEVGPLLDPGSPVNPLHRKNEFDWRLWLAAIAMVFTVVVVYLSLSSFVGRQTQVAILPIRADSAVQSAAATLIEDRLTTELVRLDGVSVISAEAVTALGSSNFGYLHSELGAKWVLEGRLRATVDGVRISLSVVDAKSYLIIHTRIEEVDGSEASLAKLASSYATQIQALAKES